MDDNYINLAAAIVLQAMSDYKKALRDEDSKTIKECEKFFLSEYGQYLSGHRGKYAIERCKKEIEQEKEKKE